MITAVENFVDNFPHHHIPNVCGELECDLIFFSREIYHANALLVKMKLRDINLGYLGLAEPSRRDTITRMN